MTRVVVQLNEVDRRIWAEELDAFVPRQVFDVHTHIYRWEFNTDPNKESGDYADLVRDDFRLAGRQQLDAWDAALLPGRSVHRLSFGFPFWPDCDFEASNRFVAEQAAQDPMSGALMLVHPSMTLQHLEEQIRACGFLGLKPYRLYTRSGDPDACRITDFLPEEQIEIAHRHGLLIMLHLSMRDAIADETNINDLRRLTAKYSNAKWILAHCGRSYSAWAIERAAQRVRDLPNVWYDVSSVCESDAIAALIRCIGPERVMYGSDDLPVGALRGKYVTFGYAWAFLSDRNHALDLSHCMPQMTFVRYEQLRAMRRAALATGLSRHQIENLFYHTAATLVQSARSHTSPRIGRRLDPAVTVTASIHSHAEEARQTLEGINGAIDL